jgi:ribosomal protein L37AE/L43A
MKNEKSLQGLKGEDTKRCPECKSKDIVRENNEIYCKKCGYVIEQ